MRDRIPCRGWMYAGRNVAGLEGHRLTSERLLEGYHLLPSVRGDLLAKLGRFDESRAEFERDLLLARAARSAEGAEP